MKPKCNEQNELTPQTQKAPEDKTTNARYQRLPLNKRQKAGYSLIPSITSEDDYGHRQLLEYAGLPPSFCASRGDADLPTHYSIQTPLIKFMGSSLGRAVIFPDWIAMLLIAVVAHEKSYRGRKTNSRCQRKEQLPLLAKAIESLPAHWSWPSNA
jgi:hypothetical protein